MRKTITFLGLCFIVSILYSKLDAFFAIAIACEKYGYHSQIAYKYAYGSESGLSALQKAQVDIQREVVDFGVKDGRSWDVFVRNPSKITGDFTIAHGFFAIVRGIAVNASESGVYVAVLGVGISKNDPLGAISKAREDIKKTIEKINTNVLIGIFEEISSDLFEFGQF
ncbi:MAG: hypothetical protein WCS92_02565 [Candidatus Babeliales bacterium]|jgi:hypothetical protein